jgi:ABC-type Zn uptake system ZnuABC Zn-binding protein ZnuA
LAELIDYMDGRLASLPAEMRKMVTNHDALGYFAIRYRFELIGTVIPAADTLAEPSASGLSQLVQRMEEAGVCTIYMETTANDRLAQAVSAELESCQAVQVLQLHTDAIGPAGTDTGSYIGMMRANVDTIIAGQKG